MINTLNAAEQSILSGDDEKLYEALKAMGIQNLQAQNKGWYLKQLQADRENKEQVGATKAAPLCKADRSASLTPHYNLTSILFLLGVSRRSAD